MVQDEHRLPTTLKPLHYDLVVSTDLEAQTFQGIVSIQLHVVDETSDVVLNARDLDVGSASIISDSSTLAQTSATLDNTKGRLTISFAQKLAKDSKVTLRIPYSGNLKITSTGYYVSPYEIDGDVCLDSPTAARRAFPCWDEPLLKASFTLTMISHPETTNLGNMPADTELIYPANGKCSSPEAADLSDVFAELKLTGQSYKVTTFQPTPLMSSYIVAFANGNFKYVESSYTSPLSGKMRPLRVYTTANNIHRARFSVKLKARTLPILEQIFDIEYALPKLDTLVVPNFDAGAMENWGLITGRDSMLLLEEDKASITEKKRVVTTLCHECAHMWFGNIVTMAWWDNLWLNEGFATLMGSVLVKERLVGFLNLGARLADSHPSLHPEWKPNTEFINQRLLRALSLDAKRTSHPIEVPVADADKIMEIFDGLSYSKSASILRMLVGVIGEDKFLRGVSIYLKKRLYGNSVTNDLWEGIQEASGVDVPALMADWIGFPVLSVTETPNGITVRQDRFLDTGDATDDENKTIWHIPLQLKTTDAAGNVKIDSTLILREREAQFAFDTSTPWKINAETTGVYRVAYSLERWAKIAQDMARPDTSFTLDDRMGLVQDVFALSQAGYIKTSSALDLVTGLRNETEYLAWRSATGPLTKLADIWWEQSPELGQLNRLRASLLKPLVDRLGYEFTSKEDVDTAQLRAHAISQCIAGEDQGVIAKLKAVYEEYTKAGDLSSIPGDIKRDTLATAVRHGGETEWEHMKSLYLDPSSSSSVRLAAISACCSTQDPKLLGAVFVLLQEQARDADWIDFFMELASNRASRRMVWDFMTSNYGSIKAKFENTFTWSILIRLSFMYFTTEEDAVTVEAFFKEKETKKFEMALNQGLEGIRTNSLWLKRSKDDVKEWLQKNVGNADAT
ncbi:leucyl aminopeptidase [Auriculariales sp. MPI-PUGE-AT-0066]|nr:leucyl aminopeptidase [Auriculariales sp. MPI-PUGE-AT-0066]